MKNTVLLISLFFGSCIHSEISSWEESPYLNTAFLSDYDVVRESLIHDGFKEIIIPTYDGLNLQGLLLERPNALYSVISCCGFYPGRKEGMASLYALLPSTCNILFLDARGHGKSEGNFFSNLHHYGKDEYKDVLGAIEYMHKKNNKPIIIHSICAGSFHAARALIELYNQGTIPYKINGFIFDSGFGSIAQALTIPQKHFKHKIVPQLCISLYRNDTKRTVQQRWIYQVSWLVLLPWIKTMEWLIKPWLEHQEAETNIFDKIHLIECPMFFIHALDDSYVPCETAQTLAQKVSHARCWWIENSEHAANHLKHTHEYREKLHNFLDSITMRAAS